VDGRTIIGAPEARMKPLEPSGEKTIEGERIVLPW